VRKLTGESLEGDSVKLGPGELVVAENVRCPSTSLSYCLVIDHFDLINIIKEKNKFFFKWTNSYFSYPLSCLPYSDADYRREAFNDTSKQSGANNKSQSDYTMTQK
jgi:hypothetical protein